MANGVVSLLKQVLLAISASSKELCSLSFERNRSCKKPCLSSCLQPSPVNAVLKEGGVEGRGCVEGRGEQRASEAKEGAGLTGGRVLRWGLQHCHSVLRSGGDAGGSERSNGNGEESRS